MADPAGSSRVSLDRRVALAMVEALPPDERLDGVAQALERLCRAAVTHLGLVGASVRLLPDGASVAVAATAHGTPARLADIELETGEGPGAAATALARPVLVADLTGPEGDAWPGYRAAVADLGVMAVFVYPLHLGASALGTFELFSGRAGMPTREETSLARTLAAVAVAIVLDGDVTQEDGGLAAGLARVSEHRDEIAQAQGMVMVDLGVGLTEALARLSAHASARGLPLSRVARDVVQGGYRLSSAEDEDDSD